MKTNPAMTRRSGASLKQTTLTLAVVAAFCSAYAMSASAAITGVGAPATVARTTLLAQGDAVIGTLPMTHPIHIEVALKLRNKDVLDAFIANTAKKQAKGVPTAPMSGAEFVANHSPTAGQAQAVADYLTSMGYKNVVIAPNRLLVSADGTAMTARNAFETTFAQVRTHDGRVAFANTTDVRIPAALSDKVIAVLGLQTVHQAHTFAKRIEPGSVHPLAITGHFPTEFPSIYGRTSAASASNIDVGIVTVGSLSQTITDLNTFTTNHGLPTVTTSEVDTNGTSGDTGGIGEWDLDSQDIVGMSGGVKSLIFYNVPTYTNVDLVADFNTIVTANKTKIINVSLGECETGAGPAGDGSAAAADTIFAQGVAQGQTFSISTGDSGADECPSDHKNTPIPSWPANSQYVTAVAGTRLDASTTTWSSEIVWSGSGGSPSLYEPIPSWQSGFGIAGTKRVVADVAFDADPNSGSKIIVSGLLQQYGGTSLAAPLFAGQWARVLHVHPTIGFAGPVIYALPSGDFHDITTGNNGGEVAAVGYDAASGRGSMLTDSMITDTAGLGNQPPVADFTFTSGGLTANFTDTSTDDVAIFTHVWRFGDGAISNAANPSHTYATAGTYSVKDTVKDQVGAVTSKIKSVTVGQYLSNTGFETGVATPWTITPAGRLTNDASLAHAGNWFAAIGGDFATDRVSQAVAIPSGNSSASLAFQLHVITAETTTTIVRDKLNVQVWNNGVLLSTLATYSNLDASSGYVLHTLDVSPYIGQTVVIRFVGANNASLTTSWYLDDVTLTGL